MSRRRTRIVYIEPGGGLACCSGRIGGVVLSKTGRTLYYGSLVLQSLGGSGYKTNYFDVETSEPYWISGPRRDGNDPLYPGIVEIDADVRDAYWREIRNLPDHSDVASFRAPGKHSKRRPHPDGFRRRAK